VENSNGYKDIAIIKYSHQRPSPESLVSETGP